MPYVNPEAPIIVYTPSEWRLVLGERLEARRAGRSIYSCDTSGVGYQVVRRMERGGNVTIALDTLYMLCAHYGCSLGGLLDPNRDVPGSWAGAKAPPYPQLDVHVRRELRATRTRSGLGTKLLSRACKENDPRCHQSWLVRIEGGNVATLDVIRLATVTACLGVTLPDLLPSVLRGTRLAPLPAEAFAS